MNSGFATLMMVLSFYLIILAESLKNYITEKS